MYRVNRLIQSYIRTAVARTITTPTVVTFDQCKLLNQSCRARCLLYSRQQVTLHTCSSLWNPSLVSFKLSDIGEGIKEVEVKEWFVAIGDAVQQFDDICEVQSDKASVTITSRYDGIIKKLFYEVGDIAQVGDPLVDIEVESADGESSAPTTDSNVEAEIPTADPASSSEVLSVDKALATPAVRHMAKEKNILLADVQGSGKDGRILKEDILRHVGQSIVPDDQAPPSMSAPPKVVPSGTDKVEPIRGIKRVMFASMTKSLTIPHFGYDDEYDLSQLVELRSRLKKEVKHSTGVKLSYMPFIVKATSLALSHFPILNSQIDPTGENLIYKADHNISVAVDTQHGLLLPCIKRVQNQSVVEVAIELNRLHEAGLNNKLTPDDLVDGTFSLSNIGNIGGTYARPVIFPPQVAIGALGKIQVLPRFDREGDLMKAHVMCVSWSGDHRVIEGATMARFSNKLKDYLENPSKMLLDLK